MTEEELDALVAKIRMIHEWKLGSYAADALTALRAQLAEVKAEGSSLASWQCEFTDGKTGLVCDEYGNQFCAMKARAEKAEAALAAQIEADAGLCEDSMKALKTIDAARGEILVANALALRIRNQPRDRSALDRMMAVAREKALREAIAAAREEAWPEDGTYQPSEKLIEDAERATVEVIESAILALIDKPANP